MTALTAIQKTCSRLGMPSPNAVFSSTAENIIQLRNLMNEAGEELAREHTWQKLLTEATFTTVAAYLQTSAVPSDFDWYVNNTMWNRTLVQKIHGPFNAVEWQRERANPTASVIGGAFMFRNDNIYITPTPTAGQTVAYEYVTKDWAETSGGTGLSAMTSDSDVFRVPEHLVVLSLLWRFKSAKGLDYGELFRTFELEKNKAIARDGGRRTHDLSGRQINLFNANIPEGSWS